MSEQHIESGNTSSGYGVSTPHSGPLAGRGGEGSLQTATPAQRRPLRLPPVKVMPREQMTVRQQQAAADAEQAMIALQYEVRQLAKGLDLNVQEAGRVAEAARAGFRIVNGEPIPVAADRQTVLLGADGVSVMSVAEWVTGQVRGAQPRGADGRWQMEAGDEVLPMRNPFRRQTWNLTEQMRLQRRDPALARRLKAEAYAAGED